MLLFHKSDISLTFCIVLSTLSRGEERIEKLEPFSDDEPVRCDCVMAEETGKYVSGKRYDE